MPSASLIMSTYHITLMPLYFPPIKGVEMWISLGYQWSIYCLEWRVLLPVKGPEASRRETTCFPLQSVDWRDMSGFYSCRGCYGSVICFGFFFCWAHRPTHFASKRVDGLSRFQSRAVSCCCCCWWSSCTGLRLSCAAAPAHHPNRFRSEHCFAAAPEQIYRNTWGNSGFGHLWVFFFNARGIKKALCCSAVNQVSRFSQLALFVCVRACMHASVPACVTFHSGKKWIFSAACFVLLSTVLSPTCVFSLRGHTVWLTQTDPLNILKNFE